MQKAKKITRLLPILLTLLLVFSAMSVTVSAERQTVIPLGTPFGIKFKADGVIVTDTTDIQTYEGAVSPAEKAGIKKGDIITEIDGKEVKTVEEIVDFVSNSKGKKLTFTVKRGEKTLKIAVTPKISEDDGKYKAGIFIKDSTVGIGTLTYVISQNGVFGGLGHGVTDGETGNLIPLDNGTVTDVTVTGVNKSKPNEPGELRGVFSAFKTGKILKNTVCGVFGTLESLTKYSGYPEMEIGYKSEVTEGKAYILTTVSGSTPKMYEAEIEKVFEKSGETKNFIIKVTDKTLLEATGGIVRGMSGSPIIQNNRLIGAVTHVLVENPTEGYGIFIENMLKNQPSQK